MLKFSHQRPLDEQLAELKEAIRSEPGKLALRVYYFQFLAVLGDWQKSLEQLQLCAQLDIKATPMAKAYREAIQCEVFREEVFAGRKIPNILGEPAPWIGWLVDAMKRLAEGDATAAAELRAQAFDAAPTTSGQINDQNFEWVADSDSRLGPVCELLANGTYYWVPFSSIKQINFEKPQDLRDFVWAACEITLVSGGSMPGFIPTRYVGSAQSGNDSLRLARGTEWSDLYADHVAGIGQRMWLTDSAEYALLDVRRLTLDT
jgi:type VI secretion system protein ImpE